MSSRTRTMNVSLTPSLARFVESLVKAGHYGSASEVVRETIRAYKDRQSDIAELREKLARAAKQADEGRVVELDAAAVRGIRARGRRALGVMRRASDRVTRRRRAS